MWVEIRKDILIGGAHIAAGSVIEVDMMLAQLLFGTGSAVQCENPEETVPAAQTVETRKPKKQ